MGKILSFVCWMLAAARGFSQSLSLARLGEPFQNANLNVRWNVRGNTIPSTVWIYQVLPNKFPGTAITNLIMQCGFNPTNGTTSKGGDLIYRSEGKFPSKQLTISHGNIFFNTVSHYGPTNLAKDVPAMSEMPKLTTNFLSSFGIFISEIEKDEKGAPDFHFWEPFKEYFLPDKIVTNIEFRAVSFSRAIDGATVIGAGVVGDGEIYFGDHGIPSHIDISWRDIKRYKSFATASPEVIIKRMREGKAVHGGVAMNAPPIDWKKVKSVIVTKADLCYYAGDRMEPSPWLMPLVSLWATVDMGNAHVDLEIDCPVLTVAKP